MPSAGQVLRHLAVVQVPGVLPRLVRLPRENGSQDHIILAHLIGHFLADLFPGTRILGCWQLRVTRNTVGVAEIISRACASFPKIGFAS